MGSTTWASAWPMVWAPGLVNEIPTGWSGNEVPIIGEPTPSPSHPARRRRRRRRNSLLRMSCVFFGFRSPRRRRLPSMPSPLLAELRSAAGLRVGWHHRVGPLAWPERPEAHSQFFSPRCHCIASARPCSFAATCPWQNQSIPSVL